MVLARYTHTNTLGVQTHFLPSHAIYLITTSMIYHIFYLISPPTTLFAVHGPADVNITFPSQHATRSSFVFNPG